MHVLDKLNATVDRITTWQESCANLQHGIGSLIGECGGTSIADVSVVPMPIGKKKKDLEEASAGDVLDKDKSGKDVIVTPEGKTKKLSPKQAKEVQVNGDGEKSNGAESEFETIRYTTPIPVIIKKTMDILKTDKRLQGLVNKFYDFRADGNVGKSDEMKTHIDEFIKSRGLDPITVYASYEMDLGDEDETEQKPEDQDDQEDFETDK